MPSRPDVTIPILERVSSRPTLCIFVAAVESHLEAGITTWASSIVREAKIQALELTGQVRKARLLREEHLDREGDSAVSLK